MLDSILCHAVIVAVKMVHAGRSLLSVEIYDVDLGLTLRNVYLSVECTGGFPGCLETPLCRKPPPSPGPPPPPPQNVSTDANCHAYKV